MKTRRSHKTGAIPTILAVALMVLTSCGGGGSSDDGSTPGTGPEISAQSGVFLDNAVAGLEYRTATRSGTTDGAGTFRYAEGETVTFSAGGVVLGAAPGGAIITPLDLVAGSPDVEDPQVIRLCRFLQSLDEDGNLENGIRINDRTRDMLGRMGIDLEASPERFERQMRRLLADLHREGVFAEPRSLQPSHRAKNHMKHTLATVVDPIDVAGRQHRFWSAGTLGDVVAAPDFEDGENTPDAGGDEDRDDAVREIEEADIIKLVGTDLYLLNPFRGLVIVDVSTPDQPHILGRLPVTGDPREMYIRDDRVYILSTAHAEPVHRIMDTFAGTADTAVDPDLMPPPEVRSRITVVDTAVTADPVLAGTHDLEGDVVDSRIVGDILYVVHTGGAGYWPVPEGRVAGEVVETSSEDPANRPDVVVSAFDVFDPSAMREVDSETFDGTARHIHVTESAVYVASVDVYQGGDETTITYVDISDPGGRIARRGSVRVTGRVEDRFKMDAFNGSFRVCAYDWADGGMSHLYVIDTADPDHMEVAGRVALGRGEQLFATRFDGERAYLVTYERKDPLWVIDLSDPSVPRVAGELVVPGWSTHIEPLGDRLVALGVDDTDGWKVAVSLFDVSDPTAPGLVERVSFGDGPGWSSSSAHQDVKAFTVLPEMGLILLPYTTEAWENGTYRSEHRLQLIDFSPDDLMVRGWIRQRGSVQRSRSFSDRLFSVSAEELQVIDAADRDNPRTTAILPLAANIADFMPLENGHGVQVVAEDYRPALLRAVPLPDPETGTPAGEIPLPAADLTGIFGNGGFVYTLSMTYPDNAVEPAAGGDADIAPYYDGAAVVRVYDFSTPASPRERGSIEVPGSYGYPVPMMEGMAIHPFVGTNQAIQVEPDLLVFVGGGGYYYPPYMDHGAPEGVSLTAVSLADPDVPAVVSEMTLEIPGATGWFARNGVLYFSYPGERETEGGDGPRVQYLLGRIDFTDSADPVELPAVNIPGICMGMDGFGPYIFTMDMAWEGDGSPEATFNALKLEGDSAYLLDSVSLDGLRSEAVIADGLAWITETGYRVREGRNLTLIDLSDPEDLAVHEHAVNMAWPEMVGAAGDKGFIHTYGGTACFDASDPSDLALDEFRSHLGWVDTARFHEGRAYLPLGFYGVWIKDL